MEGSRQSTNGFPPMSRVLTAGELQAIGAELIAEAAGSAPAKILARSTGLTERHIRSLRQREHQPGWAASIALALQHPELRSFFLRVLGAAPGPNSAALLREAAEIVERYGALAPEEGDREGG